MTNYKVRFIDRFLRFDTTKDNITVTLLPFAQTPNAPFELQRVTTGDGHTVTVQADPTTSDFLLPDGTKKLVLDDTTFWVLIKIPETGQSPALCHSGGAGAGAAGPSAPPFEADSVNNTVPPGVTMVNVDGTNAPYDLWFTLSATPITFTRVEVPPNTKTVSIKDLNSSVLDPSGLTAIGLNNLAYSSVTVVSQ